MNFFYCPYEACVCIVISRVDLKVLSPKKMNNGQPTILHESLQKVFCFVLFFPPVKCQKPLEPGRISELSIQFEGGWNDSQEEDATEMP